MVDDSNPLVSIIIPVYNVQEQYLRYCIDSCVRQSLNNIEIILVDDGSTNNGGTICDEYAQSGIQVTVIHQVNGGVGNARNTALHYIHGKWVMFLDADDWLESDAVEKLIDRVFQTDVDILCFNHFYNSEFREWKRESFIPSTLSRKDENIVWLIIDMLYPYYDYKRNGVSVGAIRGVWGKLYKSAVLLDNNIRFNEKLKIAEDALFNYEVFKRCNHIQFYNDYLIHHRVHRGSVMQKYNPEIIKINEDIMTEFFERIKCEEGVSDYRFAYAGLVSECVFRTMKLFLLHPNNDSSLWERVKMFKKSVDNDFCRYAEQLTSFKCLSHGKREIMYCIKYKWYLGVFIISWLSIKYLNLKIRYE